MAKLSAEELQEIFHAVRAQVKPYEKGSIQARADVPGKYDLWSEKPVEIVGRKYPAIAFAAVMIMSSYVGFYFMPSYTTENLKTDFHPDLLRQLKGKSCFHIKTKDPAMMAHIADALEKGLAIYRQNGWAD